MSDTFARTVLVDEESPGAIDCATVAGSVDEETEGMIESER